MVLRFSIALLLSIPASIALIGVLLILLPANDSLIISLLLMTFPTWVLLASASYMFDSPAHSAQFLAAISIIGFSIIATLRITGFSSL